MASNWFTDLCNQFNRLCSEANDIVPEEPIQYVRSQFLAVGESIKQCLYTELVDSVIPEEKHTDSPVVEEGSNCPGVKCSQDDEVITSDNALSTQARASNDYMKSEGEFIRWFSETFNYDLSGEYLFGEPSEREMLDQSAIVLDNSDYDIEDARVSTQVVHVFDSKTEEETGGDCAKELQVKWDIEYLSDSDWELI